MSQKKKQKKSIEEEILENRKERKEVEEEIEVVKPKVTNRKKFSKKFDDLKIKYKKDPKKYIVMASCLLLALALLGGTSYAYLSYVSKTGNTTVIEAGTLALTFLNESNAITLDNAVPQQDNNALEENTEYTFSIKNNGSLAASYKITLDNTCTLDKTYSINGESVKPDACIPDSHIKVGIKEGNGEYTVLDKTSENDYVIAAGSLNGGAEKSYTMKIWLDYDTPNDYNSHGTLNIIYSGKLGLDYEQGVTETGADTIIAKVGTDGIVAEEHPETEQLEATTDYRYTGANPNNYVTFNDETWRIIGVFPTEDASGNTENRIKIIRNESIGSYSWDNKASGTGSSTSSSGSNDWSDSALQIILNSGAYYNRTTGNCPSGSNGATTACDFSTTGLTEKAKSMISDAKWYLGGSSSYNDVTTGMFYERERGTDVYSGRPTSFIGEVGLMYPSDYGYATSGGSTTSREECLAKELYKWDSSSYSDCKNNDWLYDSSSIQWTMAPYSGVSYGVFRVDSAGFVAHSYAYDTYAVRPVLALASTVGITGGTGTESDPYILGI